jgi:hypothetical protein
MNADYARYTIANDEAKGRVNRVMTLHDELYA